MLELPHTVIGAAIATKIPNPYLAFPLAFASHFLVDFIPHWNPRLHWETKKYGRPSRRSTLWVIGDTFLSLVVGLYLASRVLPDLKMALLIVWACFFSVLPDVVEAPYFFLNFRPKILERFIEFQHRHQGRARFIPGMITQVVTLALTLLIIFS